MTEAPGNVGPLVVLGGGYAGLTLAHEVHRRSKGGIPVVLVDKAPVHVLRTELYEVSALAAAGDDAGHWAIPLQKIFERTNVTCRTASVESIDLAQRTVHLSDGPQPFGSLAICLGSVASYYHVPGADQFTHSVYGLMGARRLAAAVREVAHTSATLPGERRARVVVVGGGSTGTELAAEIATADWGQITGVPARPFDVVLVTGSLPFLAGLPPRLVGHARDLLRDAGVAIIHGVNVRAVEDHRVSLEDGTVLSAEVVVWCAGLEAPPIVRELPVPHGKGGRIAVSATLEIPGHPGVFAVGDVVEFQDPATGLLVPGTAQAALAEARTAARNLVARSEGRRPMEPFQYRERGAIVAVGRGRGAASLRHVTLWGSPARLLKRVVERDYAKSVEDGTAPSGLV
jgi:NADH:ubiquinone reductase (H+-translocating)